MERQKLKYNGKLYEQRNGIWYDEKGVKKESTFQQKLNRFLILESNIDTLSFEELWDMAADLKNGSDYLLAIKLYERMLDIDPERKEIRWVLASLSSCYRSNGYPEKSIELFNRYKHIRRMISSPFLTSVAAAYLDVSDYENAEKCADRAYAMLKDEGKEIDSELFGVYGRLKARGRGR